MRPIELVENPSTSEFYPTPPNLAEKMLEGVDWTYIDTILEPSAGKGDILRVLAKQKTKYRSKPFDVDCIEIDTNLRQILRYNFSEARERHIRAKMEEIQRGIKYDRNKDEWSYSVGTEEEYAALKKELNSFFENGIHIVHDDFLTYKPHKRYSLIVMNPPFSEGDKHLLKALDIQKNGGSVICLLNAETIRNPYTETRKALVKELDRLGANIEYVQNAFSASERRTDVEVAIVKVHIEAPVEESDIWEKMKKAERYDEPKEDVQDLEVSDYIKAAISHFNMEVKAGIELIRQYRNLKPYIMCDINPDNKKSYNRNECTLKLVGTRGNDEITVNEYLRSLRLKYWKALLNNDKFTNKLTSKLRSEYYARVDELKEYDFDEFNIKTLVADMNSRIKKGIEDEIGVMFDRLTEEHTWFPECAKNRHYFDGWKTNKAHKIGKKVIIPAYGVFNSWDGRPEVYEAYEILSDIEKILNYFDGHMSIEVDLQRQLNMCFDNGITQKIQLKFFTATFYKKGTVHLIFNCPELIERFNIYAARQRGWLPPCYGQKAYKDMNDEEKAVIDSFQGEVAYNEVISEADYYLSPVVGNNVMMLTGAEGGSKR